MSIDAQKLIDKGIKYQDWELIEEGRALLAAQNAGEVPKSIYIPPKPKVQEQTEDILAKGKELKQQHKNGEFGFDIRADGGRSRGDGERSTRSEPIDTDRVAAFNHFDDDLTEGIQHTKAAQIEASDKGKSLYTGRRRVLRKPPVKLTDVKCLTCKKTFKVAPKHVRIVEKEPRYVCEKCIIAKGPRHRM